MAKRRGGQTATSFARSYRRPPRRRMGLPPRRPMSFWRRLLWRIANPAFYLKSVILLCSFLLVVLPFAADAVNAALKPVSGGAGCRILTVIDGDTVSLWCADRGVARARLKGFDAPELFSPECLSELIAAQKATWALRGFIFGADRIAIGFDGRDRYDRALVTLRLDGASVAEQMIRAGYARAYDGGKRQGWCG